MTPNEELALYRKKYRDEFRAGENTYFRYSRDGKNFKVKLPKVVSFIEKTESIMVSAPQEFKVVGFKNPLKGEYYLSGAYPKAYKAFCDMSSPYIVVTKTSA